MRFYVKVYDLLIIFLRISLLVLTIASFLILTLNAIPNTEFLLKLLERYTLLWLFVVIVFLFTFWRSLMPTLRAYFNFATNKKKNLVGKVKDIKRFIAFLFVGVSLLLFAAFGDSTILADMHEHPARYGYLGDLILFICTLALIANLTAPRPAKIGTSGFVQDYPKKDLKLSDPQLMARRYLSAVLEKGAPRSVALTGDWGSGKTAVYLQTKEAVSKKRPDIIWVVFEPWKYASEEALIKGFYETIARELDGQVPGLQNTLRKIVRAIDQFISKSETSSVLKNFSTMAKAASGSASSPEEIVKGLLRREGRRLIIVIDEIERHYDKSRTYRTLQLIHHAKDLGDNNVQLLCIFEKAALLKAAPDHAGSPEEYLEKFSELEINITPPEESSLRKHLDELINNPKYKKNLPDDFKLDLEDALMRDLKSHRAVGRAFNELILDFISREEISTALDAEEHGEEDVKVVAYEDRFALGHIKLKYPSVYRDIAINRDMYTQSRGMDLSVQRMFMDADEIKKEQQGHFEALFNESNFNSETQAAIKSLLGELFPAFGNIFSVSTKDISLNELLRDRRVGHRIVLDAYFAYTKTQVAYSTHEKWINEFLENIESANDDDLMNRFRLYMKRARSDNSEIDSVTLLRNELLRPAYRQIQLQVFRAWLRAILSASSTSNEENSVLGRVLSAASSIVQQHRTADERVALGQVVFNKISNYLSEPRTALLMLLYLAPERGNGYFTDYISSKALKPNSLYTRVLGWVDRYFEEKQTNPYEEYDQGDWSFITYQWARSIKVSETVDTVVPGAAQRFDRVNDYLFNILEHNESLAYGVIEKCFWTNGGWDSEEYSWRVNSTDPFDTGRLLKLLQRLGGGSKLGASQKKRMRELESIIHEQYKGQL